MPTANHESWWLKSGEPFKVYVFDLNGPLPPGVKKHEMGWVVSISGHDYPIHKGDRLIINLASSHRSLYLKSEWIELVQEGIFTKHQPSISA